LIHERDIYRDSDAAITIDVVRRSAFIALLCGVEGKAMDFNREWTQFALDAEVDHYGTARIAKAQNALRAEVGTLEARLEELEREVEPHGQIAWNRLSEAEKDAAIRMG
jgi:hypothetical protein